MQLCTSSSAHATELVTFNTREQVGYKEGLEEGKARTLQQGFDEGKGETIWRRCFCKIACCI